MGVRWVRRGDAWRLRVLLALGRTPPMDSLSLRRWPTGREEAQHRLPPLSQRGHVPARAGRESAGWPSSSIADGAPEASFEGAMRETFGVTQDQFEEQWKRHVRATIRLALRSDHGPRCSGPC